MTLKSIAAAIVLLSATLPHLSAAVPVDVRKNTEFMAIVARTADEPEYVNNTFKSYSDYVDSVVAPHKDHPAIAYFRTIHNRHGFSYDAVSSFGLTLEVDNNRVRVNPVYNRDEMINRITPEEADSFITLLDDFCRAIGFEAIYTRWTPLYSEAIEAFDRMQRQEVDFDWLEKFYGTDFSGLKAGLGLLQHGNYGLTEKYPDGTSSPYMLIGPHTQDGKPDFSGSASLLIHEGSHPITNPLVNKHLAEFNSNSDSIAARFSSELRRQAYGGPRTLLYETMVRTAEARYALDHATTARDTLNLQKFLASNQTSGFLFINDFVRALDRYEANRDLYPTLADFMPELVKVHNALDVDSVYSEMISHQPVFTGCNISQDAVIPPGKTDITISFDRPIPQGHGIGRVNGREYPKSPDAKASWNPERTQFTYTVDLEPSKKYGLNYRGVWFLSADGYPARGTYTLTFETAAE